MPTPDPRPVYIVPPPKGPLVTATGVAGALLVGAVVLWIAISAASVADHPPAVDATPNPSPTAVATPRATVDPRVATTEAAILSRFDAASKTADKKCRAAAHGDADKLYACDNAAYTRSNDRYAIETCFYQVESMRLVDQLAAAKLCETQH